MKIAFKYKAFITYSHADKAAARSLHLRLETFHTPKPLRGVKGRWGAVDRKLTPVFRDRDELSTGSALGPELQKALAGSQFLLVLCSPAAANSRWVNEEIRYFRSTHGDDRILAAIVGGEPGAPVGPDSDGCFPPALIEPPAGTTEPREPIAADFRKGGDGKRLAFLKVAAGMLGLGLDDLVQRDAQRRQKQLTIVAAASFAGMLGAGWLAVTAYTQSIEANKQRAIAEAERDTATASLDFLVSIFEIANPATENPKTITALTILERGRDKIDTELAGRPAVQAKLMGAMGEVYANLGEVDEAEALLSEAIELPALALEDQLTAKLSLARLHYKNGDHEKSTALTSNVEAALDATVNKRRVKIEQKQLLRGRSREIRAYVAAWGEFDKDKAVTLYDQARESYALAGNSASIYIARVNNNQGMLFASIGDFDRARSALTDAHDIYVLQYGDRHIKTAETVNNLALSEFQAGQLPAATEKIEYALDIFENVLEENHPNLGYANMLYGRILSAEGDYAAAETALEKASDVFASAYGPDYFMVAAVRLYLARSQSQDGKTNMAFENIDVARQIYEAQFPADHAIHGDVLVYSAIALKAAGKTTDAIDACETGLAIMENSAAGDPAWVAENRAICVKIQ